MKVEQSVPGRSQPKMRALTEALSRDVLSLAGLALNLKFHNSGPFAHPDQGHSCINFCQPLNQGQGGRQEGKGR